jgi:hypothetical protein
MRAADVFRTIRGLGGRVRVEDGQVRVSPRGCVSPVLAEQIREHKGALLAGPCVVCAGDLATAFGGRCPWCEATAGREAAYEPNSAAERAFLAALPTAPRRPRGG